VWRFEVVPSCFEAAPARLFDEVPGHRRNDPKRLIRNGMCHHELGRVQHRTRGISLSIEPITCQRMTDRRQG